MPRYQGFFKPKNPSKYKGDPTNIVYRSGWELKLMLYLDQRKNVIQWSSEELIIPYISPIDNKIHRYFPDFYMKVKQKDGSNKKFIIEVKPKSQLKPPNKNPNRRTKRWLTEVRTYVVNRAKFDSATEYCKDKGFEFKILTEDHLAPNYK